MTAPSSSTPWWRLLTGYHWFVFIVASAAWFFDCLDQRLFSLARNPALAELMQKTVSDPGVQNFGKEVTAWFLIGWGIGGMIFGSLGDKYGRAKMLTVTILIYSGFTGLSFFSHSALDFTICRFLTGLGVGGVFGLAVALIAETVPSGARAQSLGLLQVLTTVGNVGAVLAWKGITLLDKAGNIRPGSGWRWMFLIGAVPALMVIFTGKYLREPEAWLRLKESGRLAQGGIFAPYGSLLAAARWRKNLVIGALLASTGVVGLWGIGEYAVDLQSSVFSSFFNASVPAGVPDAAKWVKGQVDDAKFWAFLWQMLGAAAGMWAFTRVAGAVSRRFAFFAGFGAAMIVTFLVYLKMNSPQDAYWMMPLMGAAQFGVFAGFAIYLPELFPSRLRSTGVSFCYNLGRFAAAAGSFYSSELSQNVYGHFEKPLPYRYSAMTMCAIFLVGLVTLLFAPETRGQPLPEEEADAV
ncbi:MAG: MFS transporter [Chthoniobacter sp.]|nr:MFS transporter [Chthoniobacter sp.]